MSKSTPVIYVSPQEKRERYRYKYYPELNQHPKYRYNHYKKDAKARGKDFNLTYEEFGQFWRLPCDYCGAEIASIGLDRIDNSKGYELSNVVPCCMRCNRSKHTFTREEFIEHCKKVASRH